MCKAQVLYNLGEQHSFTVPQNLQMSPAVVAVFFLYMNAFHLHSCVNNWRPQPTNPTFIASLIPLRIAHRAACRVSIPKAKTLTFVPKLHSGSKSVANLAKVEIHHKISTTESCQNHRQRHHHMNSAQFDHQLRSTSFKTSTEGTALHSPSYYNNPPKSQNTTADTPSSGCCTSKRV